MSIHPSPHGGYTVRWREAGKQRSRKFDRKKDAVSFEAKVRQARQRGEPVTYSSMNVSELVEEWLPRKARNLEPKTARWYARLYDDHIEAYLGDVKLSELRPALLIDWQEERLKRGAGTTALRRAAMLFSQMLDYALMKELIPTNPAAKLERPRKEGSPEARVLSPEAVEAARHCLLDSDRLGDAALVSLLAYSGLRPGEALGLEWSHVRGRSLLIEQRNVEGELRPSTKTKVNRSVTLLTPVARDLAEWKLASGGSDLVFPRHDGQPWNLPTDLHNWRRRVWGKTLKEAGIDYLHPYALRHSAASLLIHSGRSVVEVAQELGHSPQMTLTRYAHVFAETPERGIPPEDMIRAAREKVAQERAGGQASGS